MTGAPPVSQPTLRAATAADVPALSRLAIAAFVAKFGDLYRPEDLAAFLAEALEEPAIAAELASPVRLYRLADDPWPVESGDYVEVSMISVCLLYTSPSPRDRTRSRMPSSA